MTLCPKCRGPYNPFRVTYTVDRCGLCGSEGTCILPGPEREYVVPGPSAPDLPVRADSFAEDMARVKREAKGEF